MSEPLSVRLRVATAELHQRVEDGVDILRRTESVEGTVELLLRMEAFYRALEPRLAVSLANRVSAEYLVPRHSQLCTDLDRLAPGWKPLSLPTLNPLVDGMGALYVLEGAALGGQVIARHLQNRLGFHSLFFKGEGVGPRWRAFRSLLDASAEAGAIEAATETFLAFERIVVTVPQPSVLPRGENAVEIVLV